MSLLRGMGRNLPLKLFSLAVAVGLWLFVSSEHTASVQVDFRIEVRHAEDMMLLGAPPPMIRATLQGPGATLRAYDPEDLQPVVLDLRRAEPGTQRIAIDISLLSPPTGLRAVDARPGEVEITLDRRVERHITIRPDFEEGPASGYEILDVRLTPPRARLVGPATKMQDLEAVATRPIDVAGREEDLTLDVDLRPPLSPIQLIDRRVQVFVEIGEEFVQRAFAQVPVVLEGAPEGARASPEAVAFTLKGPRRLVEAVDPARLSAVVSLASEGATAGETIERAVQIRPPLPERTQLMAPAPKITLALPRPPPAGAGRRPRARVAPAARPRR